MDSNFFRKRIKIYGALALVIVVYFLMQSLSDKADAANIDIASERINALDSQIVQLNKSLSVFSGSEVITKPPLKPILMAQSSRNIAELNVRLAALEEQVRTLRGQVDGLQFQLTQMQTFLERQQEDYEFRFEQLEGGGLGKTKAVSQPDNNISISEKSQTQTAVSGEIFAQGLELAVPGQPLGTQSHDISFNSTQLVTKDDADAQYRAGYEAFIRGDNEFSEGQFRQFIALFPTHPQAPDATNWLGEILLLRGEHTEAAQILLDGFQSYSASSRAPDLLLKLGIALSGSGEKETACRTYKEVTNRYPNISNALKLKLEEEMQKSKC